MNIYARQGDLIVEKTTKPLTGVITKATNLVLAGDSSGHPHRILGPVQMQKEGRTVRLLLEQPTQMVHGKPGGHKAVDLAPGTYEIHPLRERGDASDRAVED